MAETRQQKALRIIAERRLLVVKADDDGCDALVRGDSGLYHVSLCRDRAGRTAYSCDCPYSTEYHPYKADCSHALALAYVWVAETREEMKP